MARTHWLGEHVDTIHTTLAAAPSLLPAFDRRVEGPVANQWGPLAAARVYGIATTGTDVTPRARRAAPHFWDLERGAPVPGTHAPCGDAYEIAQVLAWIAARRDSVAESLQWRGHISGLMSALRDCA